MVISRTPFRISFFGGGTDYPVWYEKHGGATLSTTIDKYSYIIARYYPPFFPAKYRVVYSKIEAVNAHDEIEHPSVKAMLKHLNLDEGIEIRNSADLPARSGLGSSSSFTVGLLHALSHMLKKPVTKQSLAMDAIHIEQNLIKENVGSQDQVAAAHGGFNKILFEPGNKITVIPITPPADRLKQLNQRLMLFFTGFSRFASEVAAEWIKNAPKKQQDLHAMRSLVDEAIGILNDPKRDLDDFGRLLHQTWLLKRGLSSVISTDFIDQIYARALSAGAIGGKLLGAGQGGFMVIYADPIKQPAVRQALKDLLYVPFQFEDTGTQIIQSVPEVAPSMLGAFSAPTQKAHQDLDVVILAGGKGTRIASLLKDTPKILAPLYDRTFFDFLIDDLVRKGFRRFILALGHLSDQVMEYVKASPWYTTPGLSFVFSVESEPLGTGGAVKFAEGHIQSDSFVLINGDTFFDADFVQFLRFHKENKALGSIGVTRRKELHNHAHLKLDPLNNRVSAFSKEQNQPYYYLMSGVSILDKEALSQMPQGTFSFETDFLPSALSAGLFGFETAGDFHDIGTPERFAKPASLRAGEKPVVSILLPAYNCAGFLSRAIDSVLSQSFEHWELIIINDGSTDATEAVALRYAAKDPRITLLKNPGNKGVQYTLQRGLEAAKGEFIARIDGDDAWVTAEKLATQVGFLKSHPDHVLVGTGAIVRDERGIELLHFLMQETDEQIRLRLLSKNCFMHSSVLFRRAAALKVGGYNQSEEVRHIEDYDLWLKLGTVGKLANLPIYGLSFLSRSESVTAKNRRAQFRRTINLIKKFKTSYPNYGRSLVVAYARAFFYSVYQMLPSPLRHAILRRYKQL